MLTAPQRHLVSPLRALVRRELPAPPPVDALFTPTLPRRHHYASAPHPFPPPPPHSPVRVALCICFPFSALIVMVPVRRIDYCLLARWPVVVSTPLCPFLSTIPVPFRLPMFLFPHTTLHLIRFPRPTNAVFFLAPFMHAPVPPRVPSQLLSTLLRLTSPPPDMRSLFIKVIAVQSYLFSALSSCVCLCLIHVPRASQPAMLPHDQLPTPQPTPQSTGISNRFYRHPLSTQPRAVSNRPSVPLRLNESTPHRYTRLIASRHVSHKRRRYARVTHHVFSYHRHTPHVGCMARGSYRSRRSDNLL
ncbi:hypothetical protein JB92DRAFT_815408 [Gautieria morchelliformis]|nr:hypothetical protein JB92DRAFT_815408 [Gautieria morchelliformis]